MTKAHTILSLTGDYYIQMNVCRRAKVWTF